MKRDSEKSSSDIDNDDNNDPLSILQLELESEREQLREQQRAQEEKEQELKITSQQSWSFGFAEKGDHKSQDENSDEQPEDFEKTKTHETQQTNVVQTKSIFSKLRETNVVPTNNFAKKDSNLSLDPSEGASSSFENNQTVKSTVPSEPVEKFAPQPRSPKQRKLADNVTPQPAPSAETADGNVETQSAPSLLKTKSPRRNITFLLEKNKEKFEAMKREVTNDSASSSRPGNNNLPAPNMSLFQTYAALRKKPKETDKKPRVEIKDAMLSSPKRSEKRNLWGGAFKTLRSIKSFEKEKSLAAKAALRHWTVKNSEFLLMSQNITRSLLSVGCGYGSWAPAKIGIFGTIADGHGSQAVACSNAAHKAVQPWGVLSQAISNLIQCTPCICGCRISLNRFLDTYFPGTLSGSPLWTWLRMNPYTQNLERRVIVARAGKLLKIQNYCCV